MLRIVRSASGAVDLDRAATRPGRGAYVCPDPACVALARRRLAGALRVNTGELGGVLRELEAVIR